MAVSDYDPVIDEAAREWDVDPNWARSVMQQESGGNAVNAQGSPITSKAGATGLMQLMPQTWKDLGVADPTDPVQNIWGGVKYLAQMRDQFKGNIPLATAAYNAGPDRVNAYVQNGSPLPAETQAYVPAVAGHYQKFAGAPQAAAPASAPALPEVPSDADFLKQVSAPRVANPSASSVPSDDDFLKQVGAKGAPSTAPGSSTTMPATTPATTPAATLPYGMQHLFLQPDETAAMKAGGDQAVRDIGYGVNQAAAFVGNNVPGVNGIYSAVGYDPNAEVSRLAAAKSQYEQTYGNSGAASLGHGLTQTAATLPIMAVANPLIAQGARAAASGIVGLSPEVGAAANAGIDFLSGSAGAPSAASAGSAPIRIASQGAAGALQGGEAAAINGQPVGQGAVTGGAVGAAIPAASSAYNALSGATSSLSPEVAQLAQLARDRYGITLKAPQLGLSPALAYANSALKMIPGSGAGAENAAAQGQFNRAVSQTFGEDASKITPDVLSKAQTRIGGVMNSIENGASVSLDDTFMNRAANIESAARASLTDSEYGIVQRQFGNIMKNIQDDGTISGTTYGNLIHKGSPLDAALNSSDSNIRNYATQIREALRDSLTSSLSPEDAAAYQLARTQYKNLKTVEPLTLRADATGGPMPSTGDISPAALRARVNQQFSGIAQTQPGEVPLNDLARIGQLMKEPPSSGTSERGSMMYAGAKAAELGGALAAGHYAGIWPAAAGLGAGIVGGRLVSSYLRSGALANRMINSSVNPLSYAPTNPLLQQYLPPLAAIGAAPSH